jgi:hypothetical protein
VYRVYRVRKSREIIQSSKAGRLKKSPAKTSHTGLLEK